jgi:chromosome segregation ATPase
MSEVTRYCRVVDHDEHDPIMDDDCYVLATDYDELERQVADLTAKLAASKQQLFDAQQAILKEGMAVNDLTRRLEEANRRTDAFEAEYISATAKLAAVEHQLRLRESDCAEHMADLAKVQMERNHDKSIVRAATLARQQAETDLAQARAALEEIANYSREQTLTTFEQHLVSKAAIALHALARRGGES